MFDVVARSMRQRELSRTRRRVAIAAAMLAGLRFTKTLEGPDFPFGVFAARLPSVVNEAATWDRSSMRLTATKS